jgi:predicted alpha/beta-hydrolase family hydrolase
VYRAAATRQRGLVLAHGAGAGQRHRFMVAFAAALAERGIDVMTFDFLYVAAGRRIPDRADKLLQCWRVALEEARTHFGRAPFVGGTSLGGRMASMMVAQGAAAPGLVLLGYPLFGAASRRAAAAGAKQAEKARFEHLGKLTLPTLVLQGARDEFGKPAELAAYFPAMTEIVSIPGGHSFNEGAWPEAHARVAEFILR